jgi:hypothetical protein
LFSSTTASNNTAVGEQALLSNTTASNNTAVGKGALQANTTGTQNVAVGAGAGYEVTTGNGNVSLGYAAGDRVTTGIKNICIGTFVDTANATDNYSIVISSDQDVGKGSSTAFIAPNGGGVYQDNNSASWATTSDRRIKKNIEDNNDGLEKINQIRVRNFEYRTIDEIVDFDEPKSAVVKKEGVQLGVIAQEIETILPDVVKEESTGVKSVNPDNITWYLVNAVQELSTQVDELKAEIQTLKGE